MGGDLFFLEIGTIDPFWNCPLPTGNISRTSTACIGIFFHYGCSNLPKRGFIPKKNALLKSFPLPQTAFEWVIPSLPHID